jgi:hypothetical protein
MAKIGYVYLIESTSGHHKIGSSKKPKSRLKQLAATTGPYELELIREVKVYGPKGYETALHDYFSNYHVLGEWFEFDKDVLRRVYYQFYLMEQMEMRPI